MNFRKSSKGGVGGHFHLYCRFLPYYGTRSWILEKICNMILMKRLFGTFPKIHPFWSRHPSLSCRFCEDFTAMEVRFSKWFLVNIITINCSIHTRSDQNAVLFMTLSEKKEHCVFSFQLKFISSTYFISQVVQKKWDIALVISFELKFHTPSG